MAALLMLLILYMFHPKWRALSLATQSENDFSYMKSVYNATDLPLFADYDYIIVGGGTAGCPLAATLSQNYSVLVLERGGDPLAYPSVLRADQFGANLRQQDDGKNPVQRFTSLDGIQNARGRILGGSSMINAGFYSRAEKEFYPKSGINWDLGMVDKAYHWVEETIVYRSDLLPWQSVLKEALLEADVGQDNGFNLDHIVGTKMSGSIFDRFGMRHGVVELLNRADFRNLQVAVRATVERILFSNQASGLAATGVIYRDCNGRSHWAFVRAKGEVILCAGAIGSPQLLLLSGVGPRNKLSPMRIPVLHPQPNVGKFMTDNPRNNIALVLPSSVNASYLQVVGITPDFYVESGSSVAAFVSVFMPSSEFGNLSTPVNLSIASLSCKVPGPASHGFLSLASSADVRVSPNVQFNYFSDPMDRSRCVKGLRKAGDMLRTNTLARFKFDKDLQGENGFKFFGPVLPVDYRSNTSSLENFCRRTTTTWWHYHGGCLVGKVVDGDFRVMGINALRVVDGSIFNFSPGTNPQATIMMMGRYAGLRMLQQRKAIITTRKENFN